MDWRVRLNPAQHKLESSPAIVYDQLFEDNAIHFEIHDLASDENSRGVGIKKNKNPPGTNKREISNDETTNLRHFKRRNTMAETQLIQKDSLPDFVPFPGYVGKLVHAQNVTVVHWTIEADHDIPEHSHPHEQVVNMIEGEFELVLDGQTLRLQPGDIVIIPGNVSHSGRAITSSKIIDIWYPVREDYQVE